MDLSTVTLPDWLTPNLRNLMETAQRTFGRHTGSFKKAWVRDAMLNALDTLESLDRETLCVPHHHRAAILDMLIEAIWSLHFKREEPTSGQLAAALGKLRRASGGLGRLSAERA